MKTKLYNLIDKKILFQLIVLIFLQQLVVVAGTYSLVRAGSLIGDIQPLLMWLGVCLLSHLLGPLFGLSVRPLETKLSLMAYKGFLTETVKRRAASPSIWQQRSRKEGYLASIGSETESYMSAIIYVGLDILSFVLSLAMGMIVLGVSVDFVLIPAFLFSGILSGICFFCLQPKITVVNQQEQEFRTQLGSHLLKAWENNFIKNTKVIKYYHQKLDDYFVETVRNSLRAVKWSEFFIVVLGIVSTLPIVLAIGWIVCKQQGHTASLVALLATVPRQLNLLGHFRSIFQAVTSFISFDAKLQHLFKNSELGSHDLLPRIKFANIKVQEICFDNEKDLLANLRGLANGRISIRGKNGDGKSTLLLLLNEQLEDSFYIPASPQFLLEGTLKNESTGECLLRHIQYAAQSGAKYVLLDEWDANLDALNLRKIHEMIEELHVNKVVLEVRHRNEECIEA